MKKLGEGWQYAVYDLGNGRVLKKYHAWPKAYWVILKTIFPFQNDPPWVIPKFAKGMRRKAVESFAILKRRNIPPAWIGHPRFLNQYDFEQDKVRPLYDVFKDLSTDEAKRLVDKFVAFNKQLLSYGVIDKSFNITKNYGLSKDGNMILVDIGELFDDPARMHHQKEIRVWTKPYVAGCIDEVREYFVAEMDKHFGV